MVFNPQKLGSTPVAPNVSASALNQLLGMQNQTLDNIATSFGDIGKSMNATDLNEMIAGGQFQGKTPEEIQAMVAGVGALNQEGNNAVAQMLKQAGVIQDQNFQIDERTAKELHDINMLDKRQEFQAKETDDAQAHDVNMLGRKHANSLDILGKKQKFDSAMVDKKSAYDIRKMYIQGDINAKQALQGHKYKMKQLGVQNEFQKSLEKMKYANTESKLKKMQEHDMKMLDKKFANSKLLNSSKAKNPLLKVALQNLSKEGGVDAVKIVDDIEKRYQEANDLIFDSDIDSESKELLSQVVLNKIMADPKTLMAYSATKGKSRTEFMYSKIKEALNESNLKLEQDSWVPWSDRKLMSKTKDERDLEKVKRDSLLIPR